MTSSFIFITKLCLGVIDVAIFKEVHMLGAGGKALQLAELLKDWPCVVKGSIRTKVNRLQDVAQQVQNGDLFIARVGKKQDGKRWISEAIANGAVGIVVDDELYFDDFNDFNEEIAIIWVPNCQTFDAFANAKLFGFPAEALTMVAITGTNGKTTVSHFIGQLLQKLHQHVMVLGTIGVFEQGVPVNAHIEQLTTLKPQHLHPLLQQAVHNGAQYVVLEASSMGLAQHRLDECPIHMGVFLNLSADHIEDHGTASKYKLAKQRLAQLSDRLVINQDDSFCRGVGAMSKKSRTTFSVKAKADVMLQVLVEGDWQTTCCIQYASQQIVVTVPFVGDYQMQNVAAAVTVMLNLGFSLEQLSMPLRDLTLPTGRMELFQVKGCSVIVDYAHTADALQQLLMTVKKQTKGKVIVVFSCGGERDQQKRKEMGTVASQHADYIVLTTDNCRSEKPQHINQQIKEGFFALQPHCEILERGEAITHAIHLAGEGDSVVIAGKGHETSQTIGDKTHSFSDIEYVKQLLSIVQ